MAPTSRPTRACSGRRRNAVLSPGGFLATHARETRPFTQLLLRFYKPKTKRTHSCVSSNRRHVASNFLTLAHALAFFAQHRRSHPGGQRSRPGATKHLLAPSIGPRGSMSLTSRCGFCQYPRQFHATFPPDCPQVSHRTRRNIHDLGRASRDSTRN